MNPRRKDGQIRAERRMRKVRNENGVYVGHTEETSTSSGYGP